MSQVIPSSSPVHAAGRPSIFLFFVPWGLKAGRLFGLGLDVADENIDVTLPNLRTILQEATGKR